MEKKTITIPVLDKIFTNNLWEFSFESPFDVRGEVHLTGHMYYRSPYETDDDCGNCDGAKCDSCKKINEIEVSLVNYNKLINILTYSIKDNYKEILGELDYEAAHKIAATLIYEDEHYTYIDDINKLSIPIEIEPIDEFELKKKYPKYYEYLTTKVYLVKSSSLNNSSILGIFDTKEKAVDCFNILRSSVLHDSNVSVLSDSANIPNMHHLTYHSNDPLLSNIHNTISVTSDFLGNVTLSCYKAN